MEFANDNPSPELAAIASLMHHRVISKNCARLLRQQFSQGVCGISQYLKSDLMAGVHSQEGTREILRRLFGFIRPEAQILFDDLYSELPYDLGKHLANQDCLSVTNPDKQSLLYGEVEFESFFQLLKKFKPSSGGIFYDLGSGTGKAIFTARFMCDFHLCVGVELLETLHNKAIEINRLYNSKYRSDYGDTSFQLGSLLELNWSDGDVVFANSTNFDPVLMSQISLQAALLKPGAIVITFTKPIESLHFEVLEETRGKMSWGRATIYIQRRLRDDGSSVGQFELYSFPEDSFTFSERDATLLCKYLLHRRDEKRRRLQKQQHASATMNDEYGTAESS